MLVGNTKKQKDVVDCGGDSNVAEMGKWLFVVVMVGSTAKRREMNVCSVSNTHGMESNLSWALVTAMMGRNCL